MSPAMATLVLLPSSGVSLIICTRQHAAFSKSSNAAIAVLIPNPPVSIGKHHTTSAQPRSLGGARWLSRDLEKSRVGMRSSEGKRLWLALGRESLSYVIFSRPGSHPVHAFLTRSTSRQCPMGNSGGSCDALASLNWEFGTDMSRGPARSGLQIEIAHSRSHIKTTTIYIATSTNVDRKMPNVQSNM